MATIDELRDDDLAWAVVQRERTRLADALHDGALQEVIALRHDCADALQGEPGALAGLQDGLRRMAAELRALTGAMHEPSLDEATLREAIDRVLGALRIRGRLEIAVEIDAAADGYNDPVVRETVRELTTNVAQHANARMVALSIAVVGDQLRLRVVDDGVGYDPELALAARVAGHIGLGRLQRLTDRLGGFVTIGPALPAGTSVAVVFPTGSLRHDGEGGGRREEPARRSAPDRELPAVRDLMRAADRRDVVATAEDLVAAARDHAASQREHPVGGARSGGAGIRSHGRPGGHDRTLGRPGVRAALKDREHAAADRERGASQRLLAAADRVAFAAQLEHAETDPLTGVRTRSAGLADLDREIVRSRRDAGGLVLAYLDVVGLKAVNDREGHGAGDLLLQRVVATIRERLRPYDLVVRLGGDEFFCALPGQALRGAEHRFAGIELALGRPPGAAIRTGFAELRRTDTAAALIDRADQQLLRRRVAGP